MALTELETRKLKARIDEALELADRALAPYRERLALGEKYMRRQANPVPEFGSKSFMEQEFGTDWEED